MLLMAANTPHSGKSNTTRPPSLVFSAVRVPTPLTCCISPERSDKPGPGQFMHARSQTRESACAQWPLALSSADSLIGNLAPQVRLCLAAEVATGLLCSRWVGLRVVCVEALAGNVGELSDTLSGFCDLLWVTGTSSRKSDFSRGPGLMRQCASLHSHGGQVGRPPEGQGLVRGPLVSPDSSCSHLTAAAAAAAFPLLVPNTAGLVPTRSPSPALPPLSLPLPPAASRCPPTPPSTPAHCFCSWPLRTTTWRRNVRPAARTAAAARARLAAAGVGRRSQPWTPGAISLTFTPRCSRRRCLGCSCAF